MGPHSAHNHCWKSAGDFDVIKFIIQFWLDLPSTFLLSCDSCPVQGISFFLCVCQISSSRERHVPSFGTFWDHFWSPPLSHEFLSDSWWNCCVMLVLWTGVHVHDCTACAGFSEEEPAILGSLHFSFWVLFFWCQEMTQWMVFLLKFGILSWNKSLKCNRLSHLRTVACLSPSLHM